MKPPGKGGYLKMIVLSITSVISIMLISVNPLSAQSIYYRVHYPEFLAIVETLSSIYSNFIIAVPEHGEAMPQLKSDNTVIIPQAINISDDKEYINATDEDEATFGFALESIVVDLSLIHI